MFGLPETAMDSYRRIVFNEHAVSITTMTRQELKDTQTALLEYIQQIQTDAMERLIDGVAEWDELLEATAEQEAV